MRPDAVAGDVMTLVLDTPFHRKFAVQFRRNIVVGSEWLQAGEVRQTSNGAHDVPLAKRIRRQLDSYFAGKRACFDLPLDFQGTALEIAIWHVVYQIPFGATISYGEVAHAVGRPGAHRAVARSMSTLDFALFVPAHRVIGADGRIKGADPESMRIKLFTFERNFVRYID